MWARSSVSSTSSKVPESCRSSAYTSKCASGSFASGPEAKLATAVLVGSSYLVAALGNLWGTRGRHLGWALYAIALALIVFGVTGA